MRILTTVKSSAISMMDHRQEHFMDSVTSMAYQTHRPIMPNERELSQHVMLVYRRLNKRRGRSCRLGATSDRQHSTYDLFTTEAFADFLSRYAMTDIFAERLHENFIGNPDYPLGNSKSLYPEKLVTAAPSMRMSISAILPLPGHPWTQRYFVSFQEKGRRWQRAIVVIAFDQCQDASYMLQTFAVADLYLLIQQIPRCLQSPLQQLCHEVDGFDFVMNIFAALKQTVDGKLVVDAAEAEKSENMLERYMSDESNLLREIEHLGCPLFKESQVVTPPRAQLSIHRYKVWVGDQYCIERKIPFATAGF